MSTFSGSDHTLVLGHKVNQVTKYGPDMIANDESRMRLYIPNEAELIKFEVQFYGNWRTSYKKEVFNLLEEMKQSQLIKFIVADKDSKKDLYGFKESIKNFYIAMSFDKPRVFIALGKFKEKIEYHPTFESLTEKAKLEYQENLNTKATENSSD